VLEEHVAFFAGAVATAAQQSDALLWHECLRSSNKHKCFASPQTDLETQVDESEQESFDGNSSSDGSDQQESLVLDNFHRCFVEGELPSVAMDLTAAEGMAETQHCSNECSGAASDCASHVGQITVHNGLKVEIRLHADRTKTNQRVLPGKTETLQVGSEELDVQIYSIGLLGLTGGTVLCNARLLHMQYYNIVRTTGKKVTCVLV